MGENIQIDWDTGSGVYFQPVLNILVYFFHSENSSLGNQYVSEVVLSLYT